jgi:queuine tRNA-ribosyltransferase
VADRRVPQSEKVLEKPDPPIYHTPSPTPHLPRLHRFTGAASTTLIALAPRRAPCVPSSAANRDDGISICTSHGFSRLTAAEYAAAGEALRPDVLVGCADVPNGGDAGSAAPVSGNRAEKAARRTAEWTRGLLAARRERGDGGGGGEEGGGDARSAPAIFAPVLPLPAERLRLDLEDLAGPDRLLPAGLALYDPGIAAALPDPLKPLPRLSLAPSTTPRAVLAAIAHGADVVVLQLVNVATDAGIALDFAFPAPSHPAHDAPTSSRPLPLGRDMFDPAGELASSLTPLAPDCGCYACTRHHAAFLRHLLHVGEMLGWTLLQVHNHAVVERFFAGVRYSIQRGAFEAEREAFERCYAEELPVGAGRPPRVRGYHLKSEGPNEEK